MKDQRESILSDLDTALGDVLAALGGDGARGRGQSLDAARVRVETAHLRFREAEAGLGDAARPLTLELQNQVDAILRMEALIQSLAAASKDEITGELAKVNQVRSLLRQHSNQDAPTGSGRSCDVHG